MGMLRAIHALHMLFETVSRMTVYGLQNGGNPGMGLIMCLTLSMYLSWWKLGTKSFLLWNGKENFWRMLLSLFSMQHSGLWCSIKHNEYKLYDSCIIFQTKTYTVFLESYWGVWVEGMIFSQWHKNINEKSSLKHMWFQNFYLFYLIWL